MDEKEMKQALEHDAARKEAEGVARLTPEVKRVLFPELFSKSERAAMTQASAPEAMEYPPDVKPLRLKKGQTAALIWDDHGSCVEYRLGQEGAAAGGQVMRLHIAADILAQRYTCAPSTDPEVARREARSALALADILLAEAAKP